MFAAGDMADPHGADHAGNKGECFSLVQSLLFNILDIFKLISDNRVCVGGRMAPVCNKNKERLSKDKRL